MYSKMTESNIMKKELECRILLIFSLDEECLSTKISNRKSLVLEAKYFRNKLK